MEGFIGNVCDMICLVKDDGNDCTKPCDTCEEVQECERHGCVFKHSSRRLLCRCILYHSDVGGDGNTWYLLYWI